jgi:hypothetical protein
MTPPLRIGLVLGLAGIACAVVLAVLRVPYGISTHVRYLVPCALGGGAIVLAITAFLRGAALKRPLQVMLVGLVAIIAPAVVGDLIVAAEIAILAAAFIAAAS